MPAEKQVFTIGELAQTADVTTRTIRYYVSEGLLPSPEGGGRAATYGDEHLARLKLIRILKEEFLPLHEIRALLGELDYPAVVELLEEKRRQGQPPSPQPGSAKAYLQTLLNPPSSARETPALMRHQVQARQQDYLLGEQKQGPQDRGQRTVPAPMTAPPSPSPLPAGEALPAPSRVEAAGQGATRWRRIQITPGIELHVMEGAEQKNLWQKIEQLLKVARQILK